MTHKKHHSRCFHVNFISFLFLSFRCVLNVVCSFLGNSPASETAIQHTTVIPPTHALIYTLPLHYLLDFYQPRMGTLLPIGSATSPLQPNQV